MQRLNANLINKRKPSVLGSFTNVLGQQIEFLEHPTKGDEYPILLRYTDATGNCNVFESEFFDTEDMYLGSDYEPIYIFGEMLNRFEVNPNNLVNPLN